ncbi:hypothetical protein DCO16_01665 [Polynucleobacter antarcticus]|uniref:Methyltransferase domain-containing protein n=2 Tax=Polynucleobacter antarcticus TaxID=1743162 RepID=A0A6M9Q126_9BURK|nr:hypothetical protein DCO16_01665 [Polynucleobacter antarcticus]
MANFLRLIVHKIRVFFWLIRPKTTMLDFLGESFLSVSARWQGELHPILSYICLYDVLRQLNFKGKFLELGGGYSTVLAANIFNPQEVSIASVDLNPSKYNRILNSVHSKQRFLSSISSIQAPTVTLAEAFAGLEAVRVSLKDFDRAAVELSIRKFISSENISKQFTDLIFSENGDDLKEIIMSHPSYVGDLKFYEGTKSLLGTAYCSYLVERNYKADAIFFDCGEVSSIGEWHLMWQTIQIGGFALLHDIYYPKSIKNFLVATYIDLSPNWSILYTDSQSTQGALIAQRVA